jgi:hypothetical protein
MTCIPQLNKRKGSQHWLQDIVNNRPDEINAKLRSRLGLEPDATITWRSPLADDDYAEYQDECFLKRLRVKSLDYTLDKFWPARGPVWDGLALSSRGDLILVEAKAHCSEIESPASGAKDKSSIDLIRKSLKETREYMGVAKDVDWAGKYYQYTNRLAHLYFLRVLNNLPAWLVFVYFVNAKDVTKPANEENYAVAIKTMHEHLGIGRHKLEEWVVELAVDTMELNVR